MDNGFKHIISFADESPSIDVSLQVIKTNIFEEVFVLVSSLPQWNVTVQILMECYNISREPNYDDPHGNHILVSEGSHMLKGMGLSSKQFLKPLKEKKGNIRFPKNPKFANIGD